GSLYVAIGMLGATVMPHNLYLHSALVQTRDFPHTEAGKRQACKYNLADSLIALNGAFFVNAAILVMSVATFHARKLQVESLQEAHQLLGTVWMGFASFLFAVALLASGQSSTMTGTLAGQVVMEGFVRLRLRPWVRRLVTRSLAIVPAMLVIAFAESQAGQENAVDSWLLELIVLSQVVLSFQLPFAIVPLVQWTGDSSLMGEFASRGWLKFMAWSCAVLVVGLNATLIILQMGKWGEGITESGGSPLWMYAIVSTLTVALVGFLGWVTIYPFWTRRAEREMPLSERPASTPELPAIAYRRIGVAVELEGTDDAVLAQAAALARAHGADLIAVHVVEGAPALLLGPGAADQETREDRRLLIDLAEHLRAEGLNALGVLGFGDPAKELVRIVNEQRLDLLVVGSHGHRFLADLALGRTVSPVLHRLTIPVLVVPNRPISERGASAT
ncbi:MAG TPA: divalent metal cation transporter, partial [Gemmataceae bacterium]|nr:divalent metal cation transporter [Gemmataceae bacterium]